MRSLSVVVLILSACVTVPQAHINRRPSVAQIDPQKRDAAFARALQFMQTNDWIIAVSDRPAGLITSQSMNTGLRECMDSLSSHCESRSTLQITITETGDVSVNIHREFWRRDGKESRWFLPSSAPEVFAIEQEQERILSAVIGATPIPAPQREIAPPAPDFQSTGAWR